MLSESSEVNETTDGATVSIMNKVVSTTLPFPAMSVKAPSSITIDTVPDVLDGGV